MEVRNCVIANLKRITGDGVLAGINELITSMPRYYQIYNNLNVYSMSTWILTYS